MTGKLHGRGVSDMKGPAACLLHIMRDMDPELHDIAMLGMAGRAGGLLAPNRPRYVGNWNVRKCQSEAEARGYLMMRRNVAAAMQW
jgi:hypothetical protein